MRRKSGTTWGFQSTLPVWGATDRTHISASLKLFQSTLPCGGSDRTAQTESRYNPDFNPRSLCGERPWAAGCAGSQGRISIHAPRVGSDEIRHIRPHRTLYNFNPRSPCGERRKDTGLWVWTWIFQSTLPVWGATYEKFQCLGCCIFQSTLPVWGATPWRFWRGSNRHYFNPRPRVGSDFSVTAL